jgi:hypothetical protein
MENIRKQWKNNEKYQVTPIKHKKNIYYHKKKSKNIKIDVKISVLYR